MVAPPATYRCHSVLHAHKYNQTGAPGVRALSEISVRLQPLVESDVECTSSIPQSTVVAYSSRSL